MKLIKFIASIVLTVTLLPVIIPTWVGYQLRGKDNISSPGRFAVCFLLAALQGAWTAWATWMLCF